MFSNGLKEQQFMFCNINCYLSISFLVWKIKIIFNFKDILRQVCGLAIKKLVKMFTSLECPIHHLPLTPNLNFLKMLILGGRWCFTGFSSSYPRRGPELSARSASVQFQTSQRDLSNEHKDRSVHCSFSNYIPVYIKQALCYCLNRNGS